MRVLQVTVPQSEPYIADYMREHFGFLKFTDETTTHLLLPLSHIPATRHQKQTIKRIVKGFQNMSRTKQFKIAIVETTLGTLASNEPTRHFKNLLTYFKETK